MKLKKHGAFLVNFVIDFANGDMSRWEFDMDYSGYVIEHFPEFQREHPRLSRKFADTIERTYSACSWMPPRGKRLGLRPGTLTIKSKIFY